MKKQLLFLALFITPLIYGQGSSVFSKSENWSSFQKEIFFAAGPTQFLGDLGGLNKVGTQKSPVDLDFSSTRVGFGGGFRYRFHPRWATTSQLFFGFVSGDDSNTDEIIRRSRNLSFRSPIIELSQRIEYILLAHERIAGRRTNAGVLYIFSGISGFYFNPQTKIGGVWTNLKDLRTEGQGLPGGAEEYSNFSVAIPFGIGFKFAINEYWRIGLEVAYNKTFTDYIDDVSTEYYDPVVLADKIGAKSAIAADRSIENHTWFLPGQQRGNPDDYDAYLFTNITLTKNITYPSSRGGISRSRWGGRTKF